MLLDVNSFTSVSLHIATRTPHGGGREAGGGTGSRHGGGGLRAHKRVNLGRLLRRPEARHRRTFAVFVSAIQVEVRREELELRRRIEARDLSDAPRRLSAYVNRTLCTTTPRAGARESGPSAVTSAAFCARAAAT